MMLFIFILSSEQTFIANTSDVKFQCSHMIRGTSLQALDPRICGTYQALPCFKLGGSI